MRENKLHNARR